MNYKPHLCKFCGETNPDKFSGKAKSICSPCAKVQRSQYRQQNLERIREREKQLALRTIESVRARSKRYYQNNRKAIIERERKYKEVNRDYLQEKNKEYFQQNKQSVNIKIKAKRLIDPAFKFMTNLRSRQRQVLKGKASTTQGLGYNTQQLVEHLQSQFQKGMTLENHGEWHIDHILPLSSYDKDQEGNWDSESEHNKKLIHYTNLQPLWAEENIKKGNRNE